MNNAMSDIEAFTKNLEKLKILFPNKTDIQDIKEIRNIFDNTEESCNQIF